jgi:hypothetical protein
VKQDIRHAVVGHEDVRPRVVVVVGDDHPEPVSAERADTRLAADVCKRPLAVVAVHHVRKRREDERVTVGSRVQSCVAAVGVVCGVGGDVVRDEQVEIAVLVEIREGAPRAPQRRADTSGARDVGEGPATSVAVERVGPDAGDIQIHPTVVVVVAGAGTHAVAAMTNAG